MKSNLKVKAHEKHTWKVKSIGTAPEKWKHLKSTWKVKSTPEKWKAQGKHLKSESEKHTWKVKSIWKAHLKSEKHT